MILKFATKRDINGNRYGVEIDTDAKIYSRNFTSWHYDEYITIGKRDRWKLIDTLQAAGYTETDDYL